MIGWREKAACSGLYLHEWTRDEITVAMARLCMGCPVRLECLGEALGRSQNDDAGVWGGTTAVQRFAIRERRLTVEEVWRELKEAVNV